MGLQWLTVLPFLLPKIFASKYFTYLPTEEELKRELRLDEFRQIE